MKNLFIISESERERILGMHKQATKNQYLVEQETGSGQLYKKWSDSTGGYTVVDSSGNVIRMMNQNDTNLPDWGYDKMGYNRTTTSSKNEQPKSNVPQKQTRVPAQNEKDILAGKTLRYGDKSPFVKTIQQFLKKSGKLSKAVTETESFGPTTKNAIINFQKANNLTPDGVVGKKTWDALSKVEDVSSFKTIASKDATLIPSSYGEMGIANPE